MLQTYLRRCLHVYDKIKTKLTELHASLMRETQNLKFGTAVRSKTKLRVTYYLDG